MNDKKILMLTLYNHEAVGARLLTSILLKHGYEAELLFLKRFSFYDLQPITDIEWKLFDDFIFNYAPALIGISMTNLRTGTIELLKHLRQSAPQALIACGGFGPTFSSEYYLDAGADLVTRGEGEGVIIDLAQAVCSDSNWMDINNVVYRKDHKLIVNPLRPLLSDLGQIHSILHDHDRVGLIDNNELQHRDPALDDKNYFTFMTRGCLGRCTYCSGGNWLDIYRQDGYKVKRYRTRPLDVILTELVDAKQKGAEYIVFHDEYFVLPHEDFIYFFTEYKKRIALPYLLQIHSQFLEQDLYRFEVFFQSGVDTVTVGIQSASERISKDIYKRPLDREHALRMIHKYYEHRISTSVDFIVANALETEEDYLETLDFIKKMPFDPSWPQRTYIITYALGILLEAPLGKIYPILKEKPVPENIKDYLINLTYIRHIIKDDDIFFSIYANPYFEEHPQDLIQIYLDAFSFALHSYYRDIATRLAGKNVYFWGGGELYQSNKHLFHASNPVGMVIDVPTTVKEVDGLRVFRPEEILSGENPFPIIIFSKLAGRISNRILRNYPGYTDIITCQNATAYMPRRQ
jgi:radical SAM superfamily enzyme YgiQ (UPF0313 family)